MRVSTPYESELIRIHTQARFLPEAVYQCVANVVITAGAALTCLSAFSLALAAVG